MRVTVPAYENVCIAPDSSGSAVWLIGVSVASEGFLEAYNINLSNINSPTATLLTNQSNFHWSSQAQKACFNFPGNGPSLNSPIVVQQFGTQSVFTNVYPNGTIDSPKDFSAAGVPGFVSPKTFSFSGAVRDVNWFTAFTNRRDSFTNSAWAGLRLNGTAAVDSSYDTYAELLSVFFLLTDGATFNDYSPSLSQYPTDNPLVSVGAYVPTSQSPAQGYHVVFDKVGGGVIYTTLDNAAPINGPDRVLSLSNPRSVDMNGIVLTTSAVPVTLFNIAYIIDQAPDGSTVIYSINPGQSPKLQHVSVQGNVPPFSPSIAATVLNSQIVVYGASSSGVSTSTFNSFDMIRGTWSGPGLIKAYDPSSPPSGSSSALGAIIGGIIGGLVVIALVAFLFICHHRNKNKSTGRSTTVKAAAGAEAGATEVVYDHSGMSENYPTSSPPMLQNYDLQFSQVHTPSTGTLSSRQYVPLLQGQVHSPSNPQYVGSPESQSYFS
ncbi:hypothetical protein BG000_002683 [Podila horticola]|nr:hypothetical protein BG000_002683 [Podila horticola]